MKKRGQVWIETVTYTLVAFVLIGLVLSFVKPKIEELQDQAIIEQSIEMIKAIDSTIMEIEEGCIGNKRKIEINLKKGEIEINCENDSIIFLLEGKYLYSQPGEIIEEGGIKILTEEDGRIYKITLTKEYENLNITYFEKEENKILAKSPTPYTLFISNKGGTNQVIDFELE